MLVLTRRAGWADKARVMILTPAGPVECVVIATRGKTVTLGIIGPEDLPIGTSKAPIGTSEAPIGTSEQPEEP